MRRMMKMILGAASALALIGCSEETSTTAPQSTGPSETSLVATWSMSQAALGATVIVTMAVSGDHTLIMTLQSPTAVPGGGTVLVDAWKENMTWSLKDGVMTSVKTSCMYADPADGTLKSGECKAPVQESSPVAVSGKSLTVVKGDVSYVFTKE